MNLLFDVGHPAHVHLMRNFAFEMREEGHNILFTTRNKDITIRLLQEYNLPFVSFGKSKKGLAGKMLGLLYFNWRLWKIARRFKPDIFLSHGSIYAAQVSKIFRKPHISFEDTGNMEQIMLYKPFTDAILVSDSFSKNFGKKTIVYPGYHELAYLHPNRFQPDVRVLNRYNIDPSQNIIIMRFVSWGATHDIQHTGISSAFKIKAVETFAKYGRVLITSEKELPKELKPYQININPVDIFHIMAYSRLLFGESATMASEAAVLGVPAIYIDSTSRDYTQEQEKKYGLVFNYSEKPAAIENAIAKGEEILRNPSMQQQFYENHQRLLTDKIDVTSFLKEVILSYSENQELVGSSIYVTKNL